MKIAMCTRGCFLRNLSRLFACFAGTIALSAEPLMFPSVPPTPPEEAAKTFEVLHGFQMQLIAAEPLVTDPVSVTYDEDGRAYVCEMSDYPYTDKASHKPSQENPTDQNIGKVRLLIDTNDDGVFDKATIFAADLSWPTGAACWKGGIIVVATPDIWYLKDTDGDGVADLRQKLFTGLKKLNVQAVANNPIWGLDNKIYIAGGSNGGVIRNLVHPEEPPLTLRRADLRLDPVTMKMELTSGGARFGNTRDDWGNRFLCNIRNPAQHIVLDLKYLARNPYLPPVNPLHDAAEAGDQLPVHRISPPEAWRELRAQRWSAEGFKTPRSELVGSGVVTSSSGITCYRGDAYPEEYRGNLFVADVAANLFYRLVTEPDGVTFKAKRSPKDGDKEFCASRDLWHRPVNFANAPDGTLTVCDMYREAIEHPWSLPDDIHEAIDLERGRDKGRLFRLAPPRTVVPPSGGTSSSKAPPEGGTTRRPTPQLSKASTEELVKLLAHPNAWHRDTAHRLLIERLAGDANRQARSISAVPALSHCLKETTNPLAQVEALWLMHGFGDLSDHQLAKALDDANPRVLQNAISIADLRFIRGTGGQQMAVSQMLGARILDAEASGDARTQFLAKLLLGDPVSSRNAVRERDLESDWMRFAMLSAESNVIWHSCEDVLYKQTGEGALTFLEQAGASLARMDVEAVGHYLDVAALVSQTRPANALAFLRGITAGLASSGRSSLLVSERETTQEWLRKTIAQQREIVTSSRLPVLDRTRAISLLVLDEFPTLQPLATKLLQPSEPDSIRLAIIQLLRQKTDGAIVKLLLDAWPTLTPLPREAAAQAMAARTAWTEALIAAVEKQQIKPAEISPTIRASLQRLSNTALRERAAKLFAVSGTRTEVLAKYRSALSAKGDPAAGHAVYTAACAICHKKGTEGRDLGPNLATVLSWTNDQLLTNILDPNREVSPNFLLYVVELHDGRALAGMITSETSASIVLKGADGIEQNVARSEVKSLKSTGLSLMPEGVEATITPQQMADLMAFILAR